MHLIDTHAHLYLDKFENDLPQVIAFAEKSFITKIVMPNIDLSTLHDMIAVELRFPKLCKSMIGLHPCHVEHQPERVLEEMHSWFKKHKFVAVGEIGIDLLHSKEFYDEQVEAFKIQLEWAKINDLPVVIHSRNSFDEVLKVIQQKNIVDLRGIFHCFSGTLDQAREILDHGLKLGIGGVLTFRNSKLTEVVKKVGLKHIVLETDAPYLTPVPHRGKRNEPAHLLDIAKTIAYILELDLETVALRTTENAHEVFGLL